jgi:hypothetical protein
MAVALEVTQVDIQAPAQVATPVVVVTALTLVNPCTAMVMGLRQVEDIITLLHTALLLVVA